MSDKRNYARVQFVEKAQVKYAGSTVECCVLDISLKGVLLQFSTESLPDISEKQEVVILMELAGSDICLEFHAHASHFDDHTIGFCFTTMDSESITHLRRLLELNTGDPEEIDRELSYMVNN